MTLNRWAEAPTEQKVSSKDASRQETALPPWIFKHQDLLCALKTAESVNQKQLINIVNRIHFKEGSILAQLKHPKYEESVLVRAYPQACFGGNRESYLPMVGTESPHFRLAQI
jgi:hypothetical protein